MRKIWQTIMTKVLTFWGTECALSCFLAIKIYIIRSCKWDLLINWLKTNKLPQSYCHILRLLTLANTMFELSELVDRQLVWQTECRERANAGSTARFLQRISKKALRAEHLAKYLVTTRQRNGFIFCFKKSVSTQLHNGIGLNNGSVLSEYSMY